MYLNQVNKLNKQTTEVAVKEHGEIQYACFTYLKYCSPLKPTILKLRQTNERNMKGHLVNINFHLR